MSVGSLDKMVSTWEAQGLGPCWADPNATSKRQRCNIFNGDTRTQAASPPPSIRIRDGGALVRGPGRWPNATSGFD